MVLSSAGKGRHLAMEQKHDQTQDECPRQDDDCNAEEKASSELAPDEPKRAMHASFIPTPTQ